MNISVIVPVYNEEKSIGRIQGKLQLVKNHCEILFVDGGSTDRTLDLISEEFKVLKSEKGRGTQLNNGALASSGDALLFLHCDTEMFEGALEELEQVLNQYQAGYFGIRFQSANIWMKCCAWISNFRARFWKIPFGDQGIFIRREVFFQVGMFPNLPIMEDYQFSLNLKKRKIRMGMTRHRLCTSDRRFSGSSWRKLYIMFQMQLLRARYRRGAPMEEITRLYQDIR